MKVHGVRLRPRQLPGFFQLCANGSAPSHIHYLFQNYVLCVCVCLCLCVCAQNVLLNVPELRDEGPKNGSEDRVVKKKWISPPRKRDISEQEGELCTCVDEEARDWRLVAEQQRRARNKMSEWPLNYYHCSDFIFEGAANRLLDRFLTAIIVCFCSSLVVTLWGSFSFCVLFFLWPIRQSSGKCGFLKKKLI